MTGAFKVFQERRQGLEVFVTYQARVLQTPGLREWMLHARQRNTGEGERTLIRAEGTMFAKRFGGNGKKV